MQAQVYTTMLYLPNFDDLNKTHACADKINKNIYLFHTF